MGVPERERNAEMPWSILEIPEGRPREAQGGELSTEQGPGPEGWARARTSPRCFK